MYTVLGQTLSFEGVTIILAGACVVVNAIQQLVHKRSLRAEQLVMALLNGASIFPFYAMIGAVFSEELRTATSAATGSLALAGGVGLLFVGGEVCSPSGLKKTATAD
ncbi:hypothetical protein [Pseudomonas putida]|uniref:hypothetical protein n=1 Tax=Pseudomonas putida TaxID=303 RepID=UPI0023664E87|nr:hypothetical protein [Pseudomonas putida]MDD2046094.1 hypothetical protein [Pseudomonas putida]